MQTAIVLGSVPKLPKFGKQWPAHKQPAQTLDLTLSFAQMPYAHHLAGHVVGTPQGCLPQNQSNKGESEQNTAQSIPSHNLKWVGHLQSGLLKRESWKDYVESNRSPLQHLYAEHDTTAASEVMAKV